MNHQQRRSLPNLMDSNFDALNCNNLIQDFADAPGNGTVEIVEALTPSGVSTESFVPTGV
jgi:hypothetical protein